MVDVDGIGYNQADVAIDALTCVPAGGGLSGRVGADGKDVGFIRAEVQVTGQFVAKADVTVGAFAEVVAVNPDVTVGHDTVEVDEDTVLGVLRGDSELLAVPTDAARQVSTAAAGRIIAVEWAFDAPVVRHIQDSPCGVVEILFLGPAFGRIGVCLEESPIKVKGRRNSSLLRFGRFRQRSSQCRMASHSGQHDDRQRFSRIHYVLLLL